MISTDAPVISVMTVNPITIAPATSIGDVRNLFRKHRIRHLPVVDPVSRSLMGILSMTDLAMIDRVDFSNGYSELTAADLMTREVIYLAPDDTIGLAADMFLSQALHAAPVLDDGELVGIITSHDLLRRMFADVLPLQSSNRAA